MKVVIHTSLYAAALALATGILSLLLCMSENHFVSLPNQHPEQMQLITGNYCEGTKCHPAYLFSGPIPDHFVDLFNTELARIRAASPTNSQIEWLCLNSPGGAPIQALDIARWVHQNGLSTCVVPIEQAGARQQESICASACTKIFLAGQRRVVKSESGIGIHRSFVGVGNSCGPCNYVSSKLFWAIGYAATSSVFSGADRERQQRLINEEMNFPDGTSQSAGEAHWVTKDEFTRWGIGEKDDFGLDARFVPVADNRSKAI